MFSFFKPKVNLEDWISGSIEGLKLATEAHRGTWRLGDEESWDLDQDEGRIVFTFADGLVASAPVQIIGTFNFNEETFLWGWDHPSVVPALQVGAARVKEFGKKKGVKELLQQKVPCSEKRAWEYTSLAMRLSEASGGYRAEASPGTFVFVIFGDVALSNA